MKKKEGEEEGERKKEGSKKLLKLEKISGAFVDSSIPK